MSADARKSAASAFAVLGAALVLAALASLLLGSVTLSPREVVSALLGHGSPETLAIVRGLRLPRALLGVLVGGTLALSGASLQALLGNPLADPYLLGVSGGAACGTLLAAVLGLARMGGPAVPIAGFVGALAAVLLVGVGASVNGRLDRGRLLLSGVVVNALCSAVLLFLLSVGKTSDTQGFVFWMLGSLAGATGGAAASVALYAALGLAVLLALAPAFDALTLGEETAETLGIPVEGVKRVAYVAASLLAAAAVASAGIIGFVGLLVPHLVRRFVRAHRPLLLLSFLGGGALLTASDVLARVLFAPAEISVGAITALVGAPIFLVLLRKRP